MSHLGPIHNKIFWNLQLSLIRPVVHIQQCLTILAACLYWRQYQNAISIQKHKDTWYFLLMLATSCTYNANSNGYNTKPCLTPKLSLKNLDHAEVVVSMRLQNFRDVNYNASKNVTLFIFSIFLSNHIMFKLFNAVTYECGRLRGPTSAFSRCFVDIFECPPYLLDTRIKNSRLTSEASLPIFPNIL